MAQQPTTEFDEARFEARSQGLRVTNLWQRKDGMWSCHLRRLGTGAVYKAGYGEDPQTALREATQRASENAVVAPLPPDDYTRDPYGSEFLEPGPDVQTDAPTSPAGVDIDDMLS